MKLAPYRTIPIVFSGLTAAFLVCVSLLDIFEPPGGIEVVGFVTGLAVMWFLDVSTPSRFWRPGPVREIVIEATPEFRKASLQLVEGHLKSQPIYDSLARKLLETDPALALAHIRIEIERRLREIQAREDLSSGWRGIRNAMEALVQRKRLPATLMGPLDQVVSVCNQAAHGARISRELAADVIESGERILGLLDQKLRE